MKSISPAPVMLLLGDEAALITDALTALRTQVVPGATASFNCAVFRAGEGAEGALSMARTQPMMARFRFVEIREVEAASADLLAAIAAYAEQPNPSTVLAVSGTKLATSKVAKQLKATVDKLGGSHTFASKAQNPADLARARAKEGGCDIDSAALRRLIELTGTNTARLRLEIDKLVCLVGGEGTIRVADVEDSCALVAEAVVWELTDAIVANDQGRAMAACHRLVGMMGASHSTHQLMGMVAWQLRDLLQLQEALRAQKPPPGRWARMPSSKVDRAMATLRRHPLDPARATGALARANYQLNRSRAGDVRVFEGLVLELTSN